MVLAALVTAWRLAICPTSRSPLSVKPTTLGVVRPPSLFGTICTAPPSRTATQQFVVPKSMPIAFPIQLLSRRDFNERGANQFVADLVTAANLLHDRVRLVLVCRLGHHGLVQMRIERFADCFDRLDAERFEHAVELLPDQIDATQKMAKLVRLGRLD